MIKSIFNKGRAKQHTPSTSNDSSQQQQEIKGKKPGTKTPPLKIEQPQSSFQLSTPQNEDNPPQAQDNPTSSELFHNTVQQELNKDNLKKEKTLLEHPYTQKHLEVLVSGFKNKEDKIELEKFKSEQENFITKTASPSALENLNNSKITNLMNKNTDDKNKKLTFLQIICLNEKQSAILTNNLVLDAIENGDLTVQEVLTRKLNVFTIEILSMKTIRTALQNKKLTIREVLEARPNCNTKDALKNSFINNLSVKNKLKLLDIISLEGYKIEALSHPIIQKQLNNDKLTVDDVLKNCTYSTKKCLDTKLIADDISAGKLDVLEAIKYNEKQIRNYDNPSTGLDSYFKYE